MNETIFVVGETIAKALGLNREKPSGKNREGVKGIAQEIVDAAEKAFWKVQYDLNNRRITFLDYLGRMANQHIDERGSGFVSNAQIRSWWMGKVPLNQSGVTFLDCLGRMAEQHIDQCNFDAFRSRRWKPSRDTATWTGDTQIGATRIVPAWDLSSLQGGTA